MPLENVNFLPRSELLTFDEIVRFTRVAAEMGVNKIRLTGGEPLVRRGLSDLVRMLNQIDGITDIALTTNGLLLAKHAAQLKSAGLTRLNVSLDALDEESFRAIARRDGLAAVLGGLKVAQEVGFENTRLNTVAISGVNENQVIPMAKFAREHGLHLRFIEFMPLDAEENWKKVDVLTGQRLRDWISDEIEPLRPIENADPSQPATDFEYADGNGKVGFINSVSEPFCQSCNRLRITSEGQIRNCLFSEAEWDVRKLLRGDATDDDISKLVLNCVGAKAAGHGSNDLQFARPSKAMYQIGG
jgi:cyclic pyranopterin phosphate synthase